MRLLGTITAANAASTTNASTAVPFAMPENPCTVVYEPAATGLQVKHGATATAADFALGTAPRWALPWGGRASGLVALRNDTGAPIACKVYATDILGFVLPLS